MTAIGAANEGDRILFQSNFTLTNATRLTVGKEITFETADIDKTGNAIEERFSILRSASFENDHLIIVNESGVLTLKNIAINGQLTYSATAAGSNILVTGTSTTSPDEGGKLIILEGALLTGDHSVFYEPLGNKQVGGGGLYLLNGTLEMYGGEISGNFTKHSLSSAIGSYYMSSIRMILQGGLITDNVSNKGKAFQVHEHTIIGGDFTVKDNWSSTAKTEQANINIHSKAKIEEGFSGTLYVIDSSPERLKEVGFEYLGKDDFPIKTIRPDSDPNLHLRTEGDTVVWDYYYTDYQEYIKPTFVDQGEVRQYAIIDEASSDTIYNDLPVLKLNGEDYTPTTNAEENTVTFKLNETISGNNIQFEYTAAELDTLVEEDFDKKKADPKANSEILAMIEACEESIKEEMSIDEKLVLILSKFSEIELKFVETDKNLVREGLETYNVIYSESVSAEVELIISEQVALVNKNNYEDEGVINQIIQDGKDLIDIYYLEQAKAEKKTELLGQYRQGDYNTENWEEISIIIESIKDEIDAFTKIEDIETYNISEASQSALDEIITIAEQLAEVKNTQKLEVEKLLENYNEEDYTEANYNKILQIIASAKNEVDALTTIEEVSNFNVEEVKVFSDAVKTIAQELFEGAKAAKIAEIDIVTKKYNAYNYGNQNFVEITQLINTAKQTINEATDEVAFEGIVEGLQTTLSVYKIIKESEGKYETSDQNLDYENGDIEEYYSIVENESGLDSGVKVIVTRVEN